MFENTTVLDLKELDSTNIKELFKDQWWLEHYHLLMLKKSTKILINPDDIQFIEERIVDNRNLFKAQLLSAITKEEKGYNSILEEQTVIAKNPEPESEDNAIHQNASGVARLMRYFGCFSDTARKDTPSTSPGPWNAWIEMNVGPIVDVSKKEFIRFIIKIKADLRTKLDPRMAEAIFKKLCLPVPAGECLTVSLHEESVLVPSNEKLKLYEEPSLFEKIASIYKARTLDKVLESLIDQFRTLEENIEDKMESLRRFLGPIFAAEPTLKNHANAELNMMLRQLSARIGETPVNDSPLYIKTLLNPSTIDDSQKIGIKWLQNSIKWVIQNREWSDDKAHYGVQLGSQTSRHRTQSIDVSYDEKELQYEIDEHRGSLRGLSKEIQEDIISQLPIGKQSAKRLEDPKEVWAVLRETTQNDHTYSCEKEEFNFINFNTNFFAQTNQVTELNKNRLVFALDQIQSEVECYLRNKDEAAVSVTAISLPTPRI